ncbi:MAG: DUF6503 family protein [Bryobacteraceae bacterium]
MKSYLAGALALSLTAGAFAAKQGAYPEHLSADRGGKLIIASIEALGGWDNWKSKRNIQYRRDGTRYETDGKVTHEVQFHKLTLPPEVKVRQESLRDGKRIVTGFDGSNGWVMEDGKPITDAKRVSGARNSSFGTQYMLCAPFKLADPGTIHEYLGSVKLSNGTFDKVKVTYRAGTGDNPSHVWTYYFNQKTHFMERLDWSNTENTSHSISEYGNFRKIDGLWWPMRRTNYERNPKGDKGRRTSDLLYKNVRFNNDFAPDTFAKPVAEGSRR